MAANGIHKIKNFVYLICFWKLKPWYLLRLIGAQLLSYSFHLKFSWLCSILPSTEFSLPIVISFLLSDIKWNDQEYIFQ